MQWLVESSDRPLDCAFSSPARAVAAAIEVCSVYGIAALTQVIERERPDLRLGWISTLETIRRRALARGMDGSAYR